MVKDHKILENQSIYDVANITLGGFDNIYIGLIQQNTIIDSIDFDLNTIATQNLLYDDIYYKSPTLQIQLDVPTSSSTTIYKGLENQSIYDVVLMNYGGLDNIYSFIQNNDLVSINDLSVAYKSLIFDNTKILNETLVKNVSNKNYNFASILLDERFVWDGDFIIWDGTDKLIY